jgi:hypothetical protein
MKKITSTRSSQDLQKKPAGKKRSGGLKAVAVHDTFRSSTTTKSPLASPPAKSPTGRGKNLAQAMEKKVSNELINIAGPIGKFLGEVEKKPKHSVVTTLDAEQGSGKTRFFFQVLDALASMGKNCLFYSLEEHPESKLFKDKVEQYINPSNFNRITVIDEVVDWKEERKEIEAHDVIFIDSFQKLPQIDLDTDIRKAFNGKWFFIIYQQTGSKSMRGGSKAAFDGDQILKVNKNEEDYRRNYVYANKNRYNDIPDIKYNIYEKGIEGEPAGSNPAAAQPANTNKKGLIARYVV